jgi:hypothetical protein
MVARPCGKARIWARARCHSKRRSTCNLLVRARILRLSGGPSVRAVLCAETDQFVERKMAKLHHSGNSQDTALKQAAVIGGMFKDLDRTIQILDNDISTEEERVRIFNVCDRAYPILARTLAARPDNLKVTVAALEQRLQMIGATTPRIAAKAA